MQTHRRYCYRHNAQSYRVNITPDGKEALLKLSKGDMRRALNVLQACHAAYDTVDETAVYNCTGNPHPRDIEAVVQSCMRDEFGTAYECEYTPVDMLSFLLVGRPELIEAPLANLFVQSSPGSRSIEVWLFKISSLACTKHSRRRNYHLRAESTCLINWPRASE